MRKNKRERGISIRVHPKFYREMEKERRRFMEKHHLNKLTTVDFTSIRNIKIRMRLI